MSHRASAACALLAALAVLLPAPGAHARRSSRLWATVNVCDTLAHPDAIGIRGSMPGTKYKHVEMYMRFRVQYFRVADQRWHNLIKGGDSGWRDVGPGRLAARQSGQLFFFAPPAGGFWRLRGAAYFEWRRTNGRGVVRRVKLLTTAGHPAASSDPPGYSSDTCTIK